MQFLDFVNITQGSFSKPRFSNGNTLPLTQLPFGMNAFVPQTQSQNRWFFNPDDRSLEGVRLTHQPSPWIGDFGCFVMMPQAGEYVADAAVARWSGYRPEEAIIKPHYLRLDFLKSRSLFELVPTQRGAIIRVDYRENEWQPYFSILRHAEKIEIEFNEAQNRIYGNVNFTDHHCKDEDNFRLYFVFQFDGGFSEKDSISAKDEGWHIALKNHSQIVRLATSYISKDRAVKNLESEVLNGDFNYYLNSAQDCWNEMLGRVEIDTKDINLLKTFYSCLYRVCVYPNKMYELDDNHNPIHYDVCSDSVKQGYLYTNNGFWDTFRTVYPLLSIIAPEQNKEILKGFLQCYLNLGWLPRWNSLREINCMPGTLIDAVLADGAVKDLLSKEELQVALEGMLKHAEQPCEGFYGRKGIDFYIKKGYVPRDIHESVNCNQDYAYGDWCISQIADLCGEFDIAKRYKQRAMNYKNLFDKETGFMRSRDRDGRFLPKEDFIPFDWGGDYTEGSAWQNSFAVYHDFEGLADLYGGKDELCEKLDELFATPPIYTVKGYGREQHEMTEMAAANFGQCAICNQPSFHLPWMYAALGQPQKTKYWVEKIAKEAFTYLPDGFPGDEDNGTTAAWYIFAVLGFYPICPGKAEYIRSKQLVQKAKIRGKNVPYSKKSVYFNHSDLV